MTLPLTTTTVLLSSATTTDDKWDGETFTAGSTVPACVTNPAPRYLPAGTGNSTQIDKVLHVDSTVTVARGWRVTDQSTGVVYDVMWTDTVTGLGLNRVRAGLRIVSGVA